MTGSLLETLSLIILFLLITSQREYSILQNQAASFTDHPERRKKIVSDIPDPEEIDACGAMDFYQQNIWHKTTLNMNNLFLFLLTIGVRQ